MLLAGTERNTMKGMFLTLLYKLYGTTYYKYRNKKVIGLKMALKYRRKKDDTHSDRAPKQLSAPKYVYFMPSLLYH